MSMDHFVTTLTDAMRVAFTRVRERHPDESFYCYGLFSGGPAGYVYPVALGEQGLRQLSAEPDIYLRWSPVDSPYYELMETELAKDEFEAVNQLLMERPDPYELDEAEYKEEFELRINAFGEALLLLDDEGFFGTGAARVEVVLTVFVPDEGELTPEAAVERLNPPEVVRRFFDELDAAGA